MDGHRRELPLGPGEDRRGVGPQAALGEPGEQPRPEIDGQHGRPGEAVAADRDQEVSPIHGDRRGA